MLAKTKALLVSVLLLPTTVMATDGNAPPQNRQQLQIEQIQDETALYEAMLAREKSVMSCVHWSWGFPQRPEVSRKALPQSQQIHRHYHPPPDRNIWCTASPERPNRTSGGNITDVKAGQNLPGTPYLVEKITPDSVVLEQSGIRKPCDHESGRRNRRLSVPEG